MQPWDQELAYSEEAVAELQDYLLSDQLYWPITGLPGRTAGSRMPRLTLGNLLLSLQRLQATGGEARHRADRLSLKVDQMRRRWQVHWEKKVNQEIAERLPRWQNFVREMRSQNPPSSSEYAYNVRLRAILALLLPEAGEGSQSQVVAIDALDTSLRSLLVKGDFIWDAAFRDAFPQERFWFLYGTPQSNPAQ